MGGNAFRLNPSRTSQSCLRPRTSRKLFGRIVEPLFARATKSTEESRTLAALRDTLLPKLISGELRVKDAERLAAQAGV